MPCDLLGLTALLLLALGALRSASQGVAWTCLLPGVCRSRCPSSLSRWPCLVVLLAGTVLWTCGHSGHLALFPRAGRQPHSAREPQGQAVALESGVEGGSPLPNFTQDGEGRHGFLLVDFSGASQSVGVSVLSLA